ncbi:MAG: type IX secretion system sortase PorU [Bacteroidia bacterium]|nr:type IX secretion system sortase PorU [Bacteroidia bacterium]
MSRFLIRCLAFLLLIISLLLFKISAATEYSVKRNLDWAEPIDIKLPGFKTERTLFFKNASFPNEITFAPYQTEIIKLESAGVLNLKLINTKYEVLSNLDLIKKYKTKIQSEISLIASLSYQNKQPYAFIRFLPIRQNAETGNYERLVSYELVINVDNISAKRSSAPRQYASESILRNDCYKIGITTSGIYKLDYTFLEDLGIAVDGINPKNIRIYGNGGGMLPQPNETYRYDDLVENPIEVVGENDGVFNTSDYVLFYGDAPHQWAYDSTDGRFHYNNNIYSDTTYYFINLNMGSGKRINQQSAISGPVDFTVTSFDGHQVHEEDMNNLIKSGREWYGEEFDLKTSYDFSFSFPNIVTSKDVYINTNVVARSTSTSSFSLTANSSQILSLSVSPISTTYYMPYVSSTTKTTKFSSSGSSISVSLNYSKSTSSSIGWLNFIELNARRGLTMNGNQMSFRDASIIDSADVAEFQLVNASSSISVWDITNPVNPEEINGTLSGSTLVFKVTTDSLKELIAFNGNSFLTPTAVGKISKQNLHGTSTFPDLIIISHAKFLTQANRLADHHENNDNMETLVVTPQQIYNEFSSGAQDITAIRDFVKMFYDRASTTDEQPRYLLLFGDASYDYKYRISGNTNYVPTYQSVSSFSPTSSHVSDDYYAFLDDNEGEWSTSNSSDLLDIGIGRIPVKTAGEAEDVVDKIIYYSSTSTFGDWRNMITFLADDEDGNTHLNDANKLANDIDNDYPVYNVDKIYFDAYQQTYTSGGERYPDAKTAVNNRIESGTFILNYTGHGGEVGLSHERVIGLDDINNWENYDKLMLMVTATCEFSRFDDPERTSGGELCLLNNKGGAIGLMSTTRLVYSSPNFDLNRKFYQNVFELNNDGTKPTLGDVFKNTKNARGTDSNTRNFTLLGDPAMTLAYPTYKINTTQINSQNLDSIPDTLKALSKVTISGEVVDGNGDILTNFNGVVYPTIFDKPATFQTLKNDASSGIKTFKLQMSKVYKGKASVKNGTFSYIFIVPKDISYENGFGKLSYYADGGSVDAAGVFENVIIGGTASSFAEDNTGPTVELFFNDENFIFGGLTNENPVLIAKVEDASGINTVGNGIGHDITATVDDDDNFKYNLNDYYEADLDNYQKGEVRYNLKDLADGKHTLDFKVWDVYNNSSDAYTEFIVASSAEMALDHVLNYPNPFTTSTRFFFEHNKPGQILDVQVQIFTVSGKLVKTINTEIVTIGNRVDSINWDGKDDYGDNIGKGVYVYQIKVKSVDDGTYANKIEKLVILN